MKPESPIIPGRLLLADPSLHGSWFAKNAILITVHEPEAGSQGLVLNRPMEGRTLRDLLSSPDFRSLRDVPVFEGGPVSPAEMMLVALRWDEATRQLRFRSPMGIHEAVQARSEGWEVRAFLGYTGWTAGQLEDEIERSSWIDAAAQQIALEGQAGMALWAKLLRGMNEPRYRLLADAPDDPSMN